jgi:hypothetical protein
MTRALVIAVALVAGSAFAKLPPPDDAAKAKAAEAAAKTAWTNSVANYQLCKAQDRVATHYRATAAKAGKSASAPAAMPPCTDPGPFAYTPPEAKPQEAAGAHSPAKTATSPPSTTAPAAAAPSKKP